MKNKIIMYGGLSVAAVAILGVLGGTAFKNKKVAEFMANMPPQVNPVSVMEIKPQSWQPTIKTTGLVISEGASLSMQANGIVKKIAVKSGQSVKQGDLILELDSSVEEANLKALEAQYYSAKALHERYTTLLKTNGISKHDYDSAKYTAENLAASIKSAKAGIDRRKLYAPFSGTVGIISPKLGESVSVNQFVAHLEPDGERKVKFSLPQRDLTRIHVGQGVEVSTEIGNFTGKISAISNFVSTSTSLVEVEAVINSKALISGLFARINVLLPTLADQVVVPQIAVNYALSGENVFVVRDIDSNDPNKAKLPEAKKVERVNIKSLDRAENNSLISGIKVGDKIVVSGIQRLNNGSYIKIENTESFIGKEVLDSDRTRL